MAELFWFGNKVTICLAWLIWTHQSLSVWVEGSIKSHPILNKSSQKVVFWIKMVKPIPNQIKTEAYGMGRLHGFSSQEKTAWKHHTACSFS